MNVGFDTVRWGASSQPKRLGALDLEGHSMTTQVTVEIKLDVAQCLLVLATIARLML